MKKLNAVQPPSGGCELKLQSQSNRAPVHSQPPSGGCELKLIYLVVQLLR